MLDQSIPTLSAAELLIQAVQWLSAAKTVEDVTGIVRTAARLLVKADGATFVLREGEMCHYADEDAIAPLWKGKRFPMEACVSGWVMLNRQPVIIPDIYADPRIPEVAYRSTFVKSLAMVPIRSIGPIGAIGAYWGSPSIPTATEVRWLQSLADSAALALEFVRSESEVKKTRGLATLLASENNRLRDSNFKPVVGELVRMCFLTKRFQIGERWVSIEEMLEKCYGVTVTHGLSPEGLTLLAADRGIPASARLVNH